MANDRRSARTRWIVAGVACLAASAAFAQTPALQVTGSVAGPTEGTGQIQLSFSCSGSPTCTGTYSATLRDDGCANAFTLAGVLVLTGLDLSVPAALAGTAVLQNLHFNDIQNPDGTCSIRPGTLADTQLTYTGTWDGAAGTLLFTHINDSGVTVRIPGSIKATAARAPPFSMAVTATVTATTANAVATIQYPASDVGKTASVYVFAFAPASVVKSAARPAKDTTDGCQLAQLDPATGQLTAASASTLQPFLSNVLLGQSQAVTVLNNASTPTIAGASFFVGYGDSAGAMIGSGVNRSVVSIPGAQQCPSVFPATPGALSGLWWNPNESGWGISFTQRRNVIFAAWYTYDGSGSGKWYVASACEMASAGLRDGRCIGKLYEVSGPTFFGATFDPTLVRPVEAGDLQVDFSDPDHASMRYSAGGVARTIAIERQVFQTGTTAPAIDYTDLWWNEAQSGWGMAISHQFGVMFLAWFVYDANGRPAWYVASSCAVSGNGCSGALYRTSGPPAGPMFDPGRVHAEEVGSVSITFTDPNEGVISYTVNGVSATKSITRQVF